MADTSPQREATRPSDAEDAGGEDTGGKERVAALCDGVFAIAVTLLAIDIKPPNVAPGSLLEALGGEWLQQLIGYLVSFFVIASYWYAHFRLFRALRRVDNRFTVINLIALLFISLLPATTSLLSAFFGRPYAIIVYSLNLSVAGLAFTALWVYAGRYGQLLRPGVTERQIGAAGRGFYALALAFLPAIPLAFISPLAAELSWLLALILPRSAVARYYQRFADQAIATEIPPQ